MGLGFCVLFKVRVQSPQSHPGGLLALNYPRAPVT